ncbi:hypothetical protein [uncultured Tateyamaria sp.]|uniref:DUF6902 family protein n=1 Tax=uncultured Tateyamaria sp. TaxID=455651 RepID=UPI002608191D|nr:hypothetical protein [uncultured Tateyamaria sp.]
MSNIIALNVASRRQRLSERTKPLVAVFARDRRIREDVFWLKENAELLNILECTGQAVYPQALSPYLSFYQTLEARLQFFPQYYRFLLSIGLDLEDLGIPGGRMEPLCHWVATQGLPDAELSDLQRAEARRLLARRAIATKAADPGLDDRLRAFIGRSATFALPNKKAAYELTHTVFYLSEYGRRDPELDAGARQSLCYAGILAYLDQNLDLLAEICVALRQAGQVPSPIWEDAVRNGLSGFEVCRDDTASLSDDYHEYLVSTWATLMMGLDDSGQAVPGGRCLFRKVQAPDGALRAMSAVLMSFAGQRNREWSRMRPGVTEMLTPEAMTVLLAAERSTPHFDAFFEQFARAEPATI